MRGILPNQEHVGKSWLMGLNLVVAACMLAGGIVIGSGAAFAASSQEGPATPDELAQSVVGLTAIIPPSARTAPFLGTQRPGSGVVIDREGLILTIGYLILEAERIEITTRSGREVTGHVVGYDSDSGLGLVRADGPLGVTPLPMGSASGLGEESPVLVVTHRQEAPVRAAVVISRRTFAGYWEYLLEEAIFTAPVHEDYAGAALVDENLRLIGIGSLAVQDVTNRGIAYPGNMFVPAERLKPVLEDLLRKGRPASPTRPWLGVNVAEQFGRIIVTRVTKGGPAAEGGVGEGDLILDVGGTPVDSLESFFRALWKQGGPGTTVALQMVQGNKVQRLRIITRDRYNHYLGTSSR